ncbi:bifunctional lysylphosphatidylglycerol flippase/synthetase MprF [Brotaphodocola sp.]|uniref:bifunctional lysylphosphatidylglycerol flippase/synthetase MprF n=1 Tax=Brotaphodocola sp. TaxID=3073577 RepID=UPI003D7E45AD
MKQTIRIKVENGMILFLAVLSVILFGLTFVPAWTVEYRVMTFLEMGRMVQRAFSVILFFLSFQLKKRKHSAWKITVFVLILSLLRCMAELAESPTHRIAFVINGLLVIGFCIFRTDFCCPASKRSRQQAMVLFGVSLVGILINAGLGYHYLKLAVQPNGGSVSFWQSLVEGAGMIFGMSVSPVTSPWAQRAEPVIFWFSWGCMLASVLYAVRPWLEAPSDSRDIQHARTLLHLYGKNPCSYLTLEEDKTLYFGKNVDGVIPYGTVDDTVIVNGDPICADENFGTLLAEFREFCQKSAYKLFFLGLTDDYLEEYKKQGFGIVKAGEEARFKLSDYEISGKKGAKMRMNINHATKAGITIKEYRISEQRDPEIEAGLTRVSDEWLSEKKSGLLTFTMGTVGLENPMDRRYFYAQTEAGKIVAFVVFVPFMAGNGYMADVTRHGNDAPGGVMETIIYQAFQAFKEEGIEYGSLGVAPLTGLDEKSANPIEKLLRFVYDNLNACYGFRDLYRAKEKYSPTEWVPSYYAYLPKVPTPDMFYAVVKIQNPQGIMDYVRSFLKERFQRKQDKKDERKQESK